MQTRTIARELALLVLGQIPEGKSQDMEPSTIEMLLNKALDTLMQHCREGLDDCSSQLEIAHQSLLDSELEEADYTSVARVRKHLNVCLMEAENVLNGLSENLEFFRLLALTDQTAIKLAAFERVDLVLKESDLIDKHLDSVMEGWRLKRLPRIDRDILRLAVVDLLKLETPAAVAFNEAVDLANRYSDESGRRMINGVLRRFQNSLSRSIA